MKNKHLKIASIVSASMLLSLGSAFASMAATGWTQENGLWRYYDKYGDYAVDEWQKSGNDWYYLDEDGYMATNTLINDGDYYYAVDANGKMITNKWCYLSDEEGDWYWFYFKSNGRAEDDGFLTIDNIKYHFTDSRMDEGWIQDDDDTYYTNPEHDGTYGSIKTGWVYVDDFDDEDDVAPEEEGWYYFNTNGKMEFNDEKKINGEYYVFDENGLMLDNWVQFTNSNTATSSEAAESKSIYKYYKASYGNRVNGWVWLDEKDVDDGGKDTEEGWYYFKDGIPYTSEYKTTAIADGYGVAKINSKIYCFDENGLMVTGKVDGSNGTYYYFDEDQNDGSMKYGKVRIVNSDDLDEGTYYFSDTGSLGEKGQSQTGVFKGYLYDNGVLISAEDGMKYEVVEVGGKQYLVNESGKVKTSGTATDDDGIKYHVDKDSNGDYVITIVE